MRSSIICIALVVIAFSIIVQAKRPTSQKKAQTSWLQQRVKEILETPDYSLKITILKATYSDTSKKSEELVEEIGALLDLQDQIKQTQGDNSIKDKDFLKNERLLDEKQLLLSQYNQFLTIFKPLKNLFIDKKETDNLNCDSIQQKINFGLSENVDYREYSELAKKLSRDLCAYKESIDSKK